MKALRRAFYDLRTEGQGRVREASAIAVGLFIGCLPFYGFHLLLCWIVGWLLRLNRMKVYLAANVSNPFVAPLLVFVELQTGAWIRTGDFLSLTFETAKTVTPWQFGAHLMVGSIVVGGVLAAIGGAATYLALGGGAHDPFFDRLASAAADRYATTSITAWEFARGKLRGDPLYRDVLLGGWLPSGGALLDIGAGRPPSAFRADGRCGVATPSRTACARGTRIGCGDRRIGRPHHVRRHVPRRPAVRRASHDGETRSGCAAVSGR
jgi:uncharacterized protein (DUF2062 family)